MSVESPEVPVVSEKPIVELSIPEIPQEQRAQLSSIGRVCIELGIAKQRGEPILGRPGKINEQLESRTQLDHENLVHTIHDILHGDSANVVYAYNVAVDEGRELVLTPEGISELREEIASLAS